MPIDRRDFYEILDVHRDAPFDVIRSSYRRMMQQLRLHPDLGGDTATAALVNKAYSVLSNPERRDEYDARLTVLDHVARGFTVADAPARDPVLPDPASHCVFCELPHELAAGVLPDADCEQCGSPLGAALELDRTGPDQRAVERLARRLELRFFTHWSQRSGFPATTEDVSLTGLRLVTRHNIRGGQRIRIVIDFVDAVGYVTHCTPRRGAFRADFVAGVRLVTLRFGRLSGSFMSQRV